MSTVRLTTQLHALKKEIAATLAAQERTITSLRELLRESEENHKEALASAAAWEKTAEEADARALRWEKTAEEWELQRAYWRAEASRVEAVGGNTTLNQCEDRDIVRELTEIVRDVDRDFEKAGGSSRHWVRDHFLPAINAKSLAIARADLAKTTIVKE